MSTQKKKEENSLVKSHLLSFFTPVKSPNNDNIFQFSELLNSKMINNGMKLSKIGRFEPSDFMNFSTVKNKKTKSDFSSDHNDESYRKYFLSSFNISKGKEENEWEKKKNSPSHQENKITNNNNNNLKENQLTNIQNNNNKKEEINHISDFTKNKRKRFITPNKSKSQKINHTIFDIDEEKNNKYKIEANKMTKRLIEEYLFNKNNNYNNMKINNVNIISNIIDSKNNNINSNINNINLSSNCIKNDNNNNTSIYFEDCKKSTILYNYLFDNFSFTPDDSFNFHNPSLISNYKSFHNNPHFKEPQTQISFGEDPLSKFKEWLKWLNQEQAKDKNEQSKTLCEDIAKTLNSISAIMSSFPIFLFPGSAQSQFPFGVLEKVQKRKKEENSNGEEKIFYCEFCNETFTSGQGLGGHMSRKHKDQSLKFKQKREIRNRREPLRNILLQAKKNLCKNHLLDFEEHCKTKIGKKLIKKLIIEFNEEYKKIRNELKKNCVIVEK